jgi:hypothetical protein
MGLTWKDGAWTALIAVVGVLAWEHFTDQGWPGISGSRVVAVLVFILGVIGYTTGARSLSRKVEDLSLVHRLVRLHSLVILLLTIWIVIFGHNLALAILIGVIVVVWLGSMIVHAFSRKPAA